MGPARRLEPDPAAGRRAGPITRAGWAEASLPSRVRTVVQRVNGAVLTADGAERARIGPGLVVLAGLEAGDTDRDIVWTAHKLAQLRIFGDDDGKMNRSVLDIGGAVLLVPNFTLAGDCRKGRRPSFDRAMQPGEAGPRFEKLAETLRAEGCAVQTGVFGAHMHVELVNDGPVTLVLDSGDAS